MLFPFLRTRFFQLPKITLNYIYSNEVKIIKQQPDPIKITELLLHKELMQRHMKLKYSHIYEQSFDGKIAYTLRSESPDQVIAKGGFKTSSEPWLSNTGSGENKGSICLSLLPEVTTLFKKQRHATIYAIPLVGNFLCPGGKWRQVISPGALPIPPWWLAREVECDEGDRLKLGPIVMSLGNMKLIPGERFQAFLGSYLMKPREIMTAEDYPVEYDIVDTPWTREFQQRIYAHYESAHRTCKP